MDHAIELRALSETPAIDMKRVLQRNQYTHIMAAQASSSSAIGSSAVTSVVAAPSHVLALTRTLTPPLSLSLP